jgi:hypothetical protein
LEKETLRLEKALAHRVDGETSALATEIMRGLKERQREAVAHLEAVRAAEALMKRSKKEAGEEADSGPKKKLASAAPEKARKPALPKRGARPKKADKTARPK